MKSLSRKSRWYTSLLLAASFGFISIFTACANTTNSDEYTKYNFLRYAEFNNINLNKPLKIIEIFYDAVNRGQLIVFEKKLDGSMMIPIRIEYVYELNGDEPTVKIYSELKKLISISLYEGVKIKLSGVSVVLDSSGDIIDIKAHVVPE